MQKRLLKNVLPIFMIFLLTVTSTAFGAGEKTPNANSQLQSAMERIVLLEQFYAPTSAQETAERWAKAVQLRNGAVQFSLLSTELQNTTKRKYEEVHWVTGTSSPFVQQYTVKPTESKQQGVNTFTVEFHMATSTGPAGSGRVYLTIVKQDDRWKITEITKDPQSTSLPVLILP